MQKARRACDIPLSECSLICEVDYPASYDYGTSRKDYADAIDVALSGYCLRRIDVDYTHVKQRFYSVPLCRKGHLTVGEKFLLETIIRSTVKLLTDADTI